MSLKDSVSHSEKFLSISLHVPIPKERNFVAFPEQNYSNIVVPAVVTADQNGE